MVALSQTSMSAGEITPSVYGRVDMDLYRLGLAQAKNFIVNFHGGIQRRPGMKYVGNAATSAELNRGNVVLIPFAFSTIQTYMVEFTDRKIRFIKNGGFIKKNDAIYSIESPYLNAELDRITYTQSADVLSIFHRNYPIMQLKRFAEDDWRLEMFENQKGPFETINVDDTKTMYSNKQDGEVIVTSSFDVFIEEMEGQMLYLEQQTSGESPTWTQRMSVAPGNKCYYAGNYYQAVEANNNGHPAQTGDSPPVHMEGEEWDGPNQVLPDDNRDAIIGVKWRYLHSGFGIVRINEVTNARNILGTVISTIPETLVGGDIADNNWNFADQTNERRFTLTPSPDSDVVSDFKVSLRESGVSDVVLNYGSQWTIDFAINTVILATSPGRDNGQSGVTPRDVLVEQKASTRSTYKWAFEVMSDRKGYPQCGTYYQQRFSFASTKDLPQTLWMSRTDSFNDFSISRPILADDSMRFDVNSFQVNEITHMLPLNALLIFTSSGVWSINQGSNDIITPESPPSVRIQSYDGAEPIRPIVTGSNGLYVQNGGQIIRDIGFDFSSDSYVGTDLTVRATHLFEGKTIVSWCYAKNPNKLIFVTFDDGSLATMTYMKEQQVWGWTSHETDGFVKWVSSVNEGYNDAVYFAIERDGVNFIERLSDVYYTDTRDQFFVDAGLSYDGRSNNAKLKITAPLWEVDEPCTVEADWSFFLPTYKGRALIFSDGEVKTVLRIDSISDPLTANCTIEVGVQEKYRDIFTDEYGVGVSAVSGLDHLEGKEVSLLCDGATMEPQTVVNGEVQLDNDYVVVHAGLPYTSRCVTLPIELAQPPETSKTRNKNISKVSLLIKDSHSFMAGSIEDRLEEMSKNRSNENYGFPPRDRTSVMELNCDSRWSKSGVVFIEQDKPLQLNILSITPEISVSDR